LRPVSGSLLDAIRTDDAQEVARVLEANPEMKATLNDPLPGYGFGQTALMAAVHQANREMVDVLLRAGADINQKSHWWAGPFHVLDGAAREPWLPSFLIGRGATPEIHHAVQFGMADEVERMLSADPALIRARGGDGQTPLHFAQTVEMAEHLVSRGADINARDIDHESTPVQYMVRDRQTVARYLVRQGAQADLLVAAALGNAGLANQVLDADPAAIRTRVSAEWYPMQDRRAGGTIYIWTLGGEKGAHEIAREFGHQDAFRALMARSPASLKLAAACAIEDRGLVSDLRAQSNVIDAADRVWLVAAASRNKTATALMLLDCGWPGSAADRGVTALHWAAFHGNAALVSALLERGAPREARDPEYQGLPRNWAEHGSQRGGCHDGADYAAVLALLS
jgi:ankyrin repeat protein